jgi:Icc-related predicted phosphoesterase
VLGQGFAGGTLWTDFKKFDPLIQAHCGLTMRDYDVIRAPPNYRRLQPADTYLIHQDTVKHLDDVLYAHPETIVVTHTAPHALCVHDKYKDDWMTNHAYYTDLDWMLEKYDIPFWFHGHMHDTHDITVHNTRIICNPYGYDGHEVNPLFNPNLILEI